LITLAVGKLLVGRYIMRPKRFKKVVLSPESISRPAKILNYKQHAGHTLEQTLYNLAGIETVIGGTLLFILKFTS
jgi:hypothetical protein